MNLVFKEKLSLEAVMNGRYQIDHNKDSVASFKRVRMLSQVRDISRLQEPVHMEAFDAFRNTAIIRTAEENPNVIKVKSASQFLAELGVSSWLDKMKFQTST